jgi:hypothetical protein
VSDYNLALLELLRDEAADLVEAFGLAETLDELARRLQQPEAAGAAGRLSRGILQSLGARKALRVPATDFNAAAEDYYRGSLRRQHLEEARAWLEADLRDLERRALRDGGPLREELRSILGEGDLQGFFDRVQGEGFPQDLSGAPLQQLIDLLLLSVLDDTRQADNLMQRGDHAQPGLSPSVRRAV